MVSSAWVTGTVLLVVCYWYWVTGTVLLVLGYWYCVTGTGLLVLCYWKYCVTGGFILVTSKVFPLQTLRTLCLQGIIHVIKAHLFQE